MTPSPGRGTLDRRTLLQAGGGLATVAAVGGGVTGLARLGAAAAQDRGAPPGELRVGYLPITDATPLLIAHGDGVYARHRMTVARPVLFRSWASLCEAFLTRQVDVVHLLMPMAIQLRAAVGADVRMLAWNHTGGGAVTVAPHVTSLDQLGGTQVAIPGWWSIHSILLQRLLRAHGLTPVVRRSASAGEVELVVMGPSDMIPALGAGSISAFTVAEPFNAGAVAKGVGRIHTFLDDVWRDHACCVVMAHRSLVESDPGTAQALTDVVVDAQLRTLADRARAAQVLTTGGPAGGPGFLPQPPKAVATALTGTLPGDPARHRIGFQPFPFPSFTAELVRQMRTTVVDGDRGFLDRISPETLHAEFVDDRFVRHSLEAVGGPTRFGLPATLTRDERILT